MEPGTPALLLQPSTSSPVGYGEIYSRVLKTRLFVQTVISAAIICAGVHVLFGWLVYTCWGSCAFPMGANSTNDTAVDACLAMHHDPASPVNLSNEIFIDSILTAFFTSGAQMYMRINDVRHGRLPLVTTAAFPRGCLKLLFPPCRKRGGLPATRFDHGRNLASWFALTLVWGLGWGLLTLAVLIVIKLGAGHAKTPLCLSPWTYIAARAAWTDIEAVLVAAGAFVLWCTRGEGDEELVLPGGGLSPGVNHGGLSAIKPLREPLTSRPAFASPTASGFAVVD